jgi:hypothetical protein
MFYMAYKSNRQWINSVQPSRRNQREGYHPAWNLAFALATAGIFAYGIYSAVDIARDYRKGNAEAQTVLAEQNAAKARALLATNNDRNFARLSLSNRHALEALAKSQ